ncbi:transposase [Methylobacterium sp. WL7]|uniref:IS701 family transposase n=1 Tax=Methylobacterium sp. WL7 TaxID=2603900 RepID=UPI001FEFABF6|nr:transposase [Methylobacterium sp. WL7]
MVRLVVSPPRDTAILPLPTRFAGIILAFAPLFIHRSWRHAQPLLFGAILTPNRRTVTSVRRILARARGRRFVNVHRILNRSAWCPRNGGRILLGLLIDVFAQRGPVVLGVDDTIERRRGKRIAAKGIYRDPVRSSHSRHVKASGLRWMSLMLLAPIPWAGRIWALPFLTVLVPSDRARRERGRRHKPLLNVGGQLVLQARRWLPGRNLVLVGDGGFSALLFLDGMRRGGITAITRLRLDAALYDPAPPRPPGMIGRSRTKGGRLPTLAARLAAKDTLWREVVVPGWYGAGARAIEIASDTAVWRHGGLPVVPIRWVLIRDPEARFPPQALLCTDPTREPAQIVGWFVRRWTVEVTFQEARAHLGVEMQRQWSDMAITRTTPCLLALFSIVTLLAARLPACQRRRVAAAAWYPHRARPPPMPWPPCALRSGASGLWQHHRADARERNPASACPRPGPMPSATSHEGPKSS